MSEDTEPRVEDAQIDDWLSAHRTATGTATGRVEPAPVWDPERGTWVETIRAPGADHVTDDKTRVRQRPTWLLPALAAGIVGALVAAAVAFPVARWAADDGAPSTVERRVAVPAGGGNDSGDASTIVDIAAAARPWVVNINVSTQQSTAFGDLQGSGTGSGVIIRSDGHIITNAHVVDGARSIEVTLASGEEVTGELVGSDPETDVAVVKVDGDDFPAAVIGSVKDLEVGETAIAIGSPLGLEQSVTAGIISALGRRVERSNQSPLFDMIQTDAPVTQGNSGGALIDGTGSLVGINSAIAASPEVGAEGIAFAIPIDIAVAISEELINSGRATHPWLGITGSNVTPEIADQFGIEKGALIGEVVSGGPADRAGIRPRDIIVSFAGEDIESMDDLIVAIRQHRVGERVELAVMRDGQRLELNTTLGDKPANP